MSDIFPEQYLPNIKPATITYANWRKRYPGEATKWDAYLDRVLAHEQGYSPPPPPALGSRFGKALVAAGELHVSVIDLGAEWPDPTPEPPEPVFTTNITNSQALTMPFTWTADVDPTPDSVQFWANGVLQAQDSTEPFSHALSLDTGTYRLGLCAWHGDTRTCYDPLANGSYFAEVTASGTATPPSTDYDYRFASFNTSTDQINGTYNRFSPAGTWWVPGSPTGNAWPDGGGLHEISSPHGPGISIVVTEPMQYVGVSWASDIARFAAFHQTANFREQRQVWEWTWRWPSVGNPGGWANHWTTAEGLTFCSRGPYNSVGHHLYLHYGNPMSIRFGRQRYLSATYPDTWEMTYSRDSGIYFPPDTYQHVRVEILWTANTNGYIRCYAQNEASAEVQWMSYTGATLPTNWDIWTVYMNVRNPDAFAYKNTLEWINHRLTVL
jgi:hypothetical protein